jgi:hypothetical protein
MSPLSNRLDVRLRCILEGDERILQKLVEKSPGGPGGLQVGPTAPLGSPSPPVSFRCLLQSSRVYAVF